MKREYTSQVEMPIIGVPPHRATEGGFYLIFFVEVCSCESVKAVNHNSHYDVTTDLHFHSLCFSLVFVYLLYALNIV